MKARLLRKLSVSGGLMHCENIVSRLLKGDVAHMGDHLERVNVFAFNFIIWVGMSLSFFFPIVPVVACFPLWAIGATTHCHEVLALHPVPDT